MISSASISREVVQRKSSIITRLDRVFWRAVLNATIILISVIWLTPTFGLLVSSFRPADQVATSGWWTAFSTPFIFTLENYDQVLNAKNMGLSFANSLLISVPTTILIVVIAAFTAFAFAWMRFPGLCSLCVHRWYVNRAASDDARSCAALVHNVRNQWNIPRHLAGGYWLWSAICHLS